MIRDPSRRRLLGALASLPLVAGCGDLREPYAAPGFPIFGGRGRPRGGARLGPDAAWWTDLHDPALDRLVALALSSNVDLAIARERVTAAAATRDTIPSPGTLSQSGRAGVQGGGAAPSGLRAEASAALTYLLDPYGERVARIEAASARVDAAAEEAAAARLILLGDVSRAYIELRHAQRLVALESQAVSARRSLVSQALALEEAGRASRLEVVRARAELASAEARLPSLRAEVRIQLRTLAALTGRTGDPLDWVAAPAPQPVPSLSPDIVVPADLLRWRPDIRAQERLYYAAVAEIGASRAALYPQLSLSGTISLAASAAGGTATYFAGPTLTLPVLPKDAARAQVRLAYSRARSAHGAWVAAARDAILEGETALLRFSAAESAVRVSRRAARLRAEAAGLTRELLTGEGATLAEVIEAEQDLTVARRALAGDLRTLSLSYVALNLAMGLGTEVPGHGA